MLELNKHPEKLKRATRVMKALSNPGRLLVVDLLLQAGPLAVNEVAERAGLTQSNASQHLKSLEDCGVLDSERDGKHIRYQIFNPGISRLMSCINECCQVDDLPANPIA
jgi:ArsR family transcriptional regulator, cadmium/lead-responsive transcriptional repressor